MGESGQVLVEFALVAPVALILIFGILDMGQALYSYDLVGQAARFGTRYAIVNTKEPNDCSDPAVGTSPCEQAATAAILARFGLNPKTTTIHYRWEGSSVTCIATAKPGCYVEIEVGTAFAFPAVPFLGTIALNSTSRITI